MIALETTIKLPIIGATPLITTSGKTLSDGL